MATQTGSIDLSATNAVHLYAEGQYATQGDLEENYYTKADFTLTPGEIATKVTSSEGRLDDAESAITQHATDIEAKVDKDGVIASINLSTETEGGSAVKISADKVNIEGAAIFTSGRLSESTLAAHVSVRLKLLRDAWSESTWASHESVGSITSYSNTNAAADGTSVSTGFDQTLLRVGDLIIIEGVSTDAGVPHSITARVTSVPESTSATIPTEAVSSTSSNALSSRIDNINVGGRNLLRKTATVTADDLARTRSSVPMAGVIRLTPTTSASYAKFKVDYLDYAEYGAGEYTVSLDARLADVTTSYTNMIVGVYVGYSANGRDGVIFSSSYDRYTPMKTLTTTLTSEWARFSITIAAPADMTSGAANALVAGSNLCVELAVGGSRKPVEVRNVKLERGNKATDWTAAPEDIASDISSAVEPLASKTDAVYRTQRIWQRKASVNGGAPTRPDAPSTWLSTSGTGYENWSTSVPQLTSGNTKYPYLYTCTQTQTVSQAANNGTACTNSAVLIDDSTTVIDGGSIVTGSIAANKLDVYDASIQKISADAIDASSLTIGQSQVTNLTTTLGGLDDKIDAIEVGGRNLLRNTDNWETADYGSNDANNGTASGEVWTFPAKSALAWSGVNMGPRIPASEIDGEVLTLSFDYRSDSFSDTTGNPYVYANITGYEVESGGSRTRWRVITTEDFDSIFVPTSTWQRGSITFTYSSEFLTSTDGTGIANYVTASFYAYTLNGYQIRHVKLERGNKPTDWTVAPEDLRRDDTLGNPNLLPQPMFTSTTDVGNGWLHIDYSNTGNSDASHYWRLKHCDSIQPGKVYTILVEFRNWTLTGSNSSTNYMYLQQIAGNQFWGGNAIRSDGKEERREAYNTYFHYSDLASGSCTAHIVKEADSSHNPTSTGYLLTYRMYTPAKSSNSFDIRWSVYEGDYHGPYKPYVDLTDTTVEVYVVSIDWDTPTATLGVRCKRDGATLTPLTYSWTNSAGTNLGSTAQLVTTNLDDIYSCTVTLQ